MVDTYDVADELYIDVARKLKKTSLYVSPRGHLCGELLGLTYKVLIPRSRWIKNTGRELSLSFALGEFCWIMRGSNDLNTIAYYAPSYSKYSDDGETLNGAYGSRIIHWGNIDQIKYVINKLKSDKDSRQAIIQIYNPTLDSKETKDVPCNILLHFILRHNELNLLVYSRSQDFIFGFPYDLFHWTMLQEIIATELGVEMGFYQNMTGSMHIYEKDYYKLESICKYGFTIDAMNPLDEGLAGVQKLLIIEEHYRNKYSGKCPIDLTSKFWNDWARIFELKTKGIVTSEGCWQRVFNNCKI